MIYDENCLGINTLLQKFTSRTNLSMLSSHIGVVDRVDGDVNVDYKLYKILKPSMNIFEDVNYGDV